MCLCINVIFFWIFNPIVPNDNLLQKSQVFQQKINLNKEALEHTHISHIAHHISMSYIHIDDEYTIEDGQHFNSSSSSLDFFLINYL